MRSIGVKVLKSKLSEYLRLVKAGETVLVTERDEVIAELSPPRRQRLASGGWDDILEDLAERGHATLRAEEPSSWSGPSSGVALGKEALTKVLDDLRQERE